MKACDIETYDLVIKNGCVLSFRPEPQFQQADIGIKNGKLHKICPAENCPASSGNSPLAGKKTLDAAGCVVSPGFIDFHSHVDGNTYAAECLVRQGATTTMGGERNFDGSIINQIRDHGFLMNHGFYLSHAFTLRNAVGIFDPHRPANEKEIQIMLRLAEKFFQSGSFGIYFGLELAPGTSKREMTALSELARHYDKKILVHLRKDGLEALDAVSEAIENAAASNGSIHILHLMYMAGHKELMAKCLELIKRAIEKGIDISADTGLYDAFPAYIGAPILDGIENKGNLLEGFDADLVIFDYSEIADHARYVNLGLPDEPPAGIRYVIINGDLVLADGAFTEKRNSGRLLLQK